MPSTPDNKGKVTLRYLGRVMIQNKGFILFFLSILIMTVLFTPGSGLAQTETPNDLINEVNALRAANGLAPYQVDPWLMAYAQEHAEYMASIQTGTHIHKDGTLPLDIGLQENVAGGDVGAVTVAVVVYEIWVDYGHRHTLTGYASGEIGAGVALSDNGQIYYTVNVRPRKEGATVVSEPATLVPFKSYLTSTPMADGSIIHLVYPGETLWGIAQSYGVTVDEIRRLNEMATDSTIIYTGQRLLIRQANSIASPLPDETRMVASQLITDVPSTSMLIPTRLISPTLSYDGDPTTVPIDQDDKNWNIWWVVVIMGIVGAIFIVLLGMDKSRRNSKPDD